MGEGDVPSRFGSRLATQTGCPTAQTQNPIAESAGCLITPYSSEAPRALRPRASYCPGRPIPRDRRVAGILRCV